MCNKAKTPKSLRTAPGPRDSTTCDTDVLPVARAGGTRTRCFRQSCRRATPRIWLEKTAAGNFHPITKAESIARPAPRSQRKVCEIADGLPPALEKNIHRGRLQKELSLRS